MDVSKDCCSTSTGFLRGFVSPNKRVCEFVGFGVESVETEKKHQPSENEEEFGYSFLQRSLSSAMLFIQAGMSQSRLDL